VAEESLENVVSTTNQRPIGKSGFALIASQVGSIVLFLGTTVYFLRVLSKPEFAVLAVLDILTGLFAFSDLGLMTVATQQAPSALKSEADKQRGLGLIKCAVLYHSIPLVVIGGLTILLAPQVSQLFLKTTDYSWAVILLVPAALASVWFTDAQKIAQIIDNFYLIAIWTLIAGVLRQVLAILGYLTIGYPGVLIGTVIGLFIALIGLGWSVRKYVFNPVRPAPFWPTFSYGFPFYVRGFLRFGFLQYDQAVVATLLTPELLASYSAARRFTKNINVITEAFQTPIGIRMAALRSEADDVQSRFFKKATRYTTFLALPLTIMVAAASPWLMLLFAGVKYANDWPLLAILAIAQAGYALYTVHGNGVFARLLPKATLITDGVVGCMNYLIAPLLIIAFGESGAAWGQILGYTGGIICAIILLRQFPGYRYDLSSLRLILGPLALAASVVIIGQLLYFSWWSVLIYLAIGSLAFVVLVGFRLNADDWSELRESVPGKLAPMVEWIRNLFVRVKQDHEK
jgi:O-antigen/teichoic acid export membrane protein